MLKNLIPPEFDFLPSVPDNIPTALLIYQYALRNDSGVDIWEEYIIYLAKRYDLSFSEIIRAEVCYAILCHVCHFYPDYKPGITPNEILGMLEPQPGEDLEKEKMYRFLSKVYFETRKAVEHRLSKEMAPKKK